MLPAVAEGSRGSAAPSPSTRHGSRPSRRKSPSWRRPWRGTWRAARGSWRRAATTTPRRWGQRCCTASVPRAHGRRGVSRGWRTLRGLGLTGWDLRLSVLTDSGVGLLGELLPWYPAPSRPRASTFRWKEVRNACHKE